MHKFFTLIFMMFAFSVSLALPLSQASAEDFSAFMKRIGDTNIKARMCMYGAGAGADSALRQTCINECKDVAHNYREDAGKRLPQDVLVANHSAPLEKCEKAYDAVMVSSSGGASANAKTQTSEGNAQSSVASQDQPESGWSLQKRAADFKRKAEECEAREWIDRAYTMQQKRQIGAVKSCKDVCNSDGLITTNYATGKMSSSQAEAAVKRIANACEAQYYEYLDFYENKKPRSKNYYELMPIQNSSERSYADDHYKSCLKRGFPDPICLCTTNKIIEGLNKGQGKMAVRAGDLALRQGSCTQK